MLDEAYISPPIQIDMLSFMWRFKLQHAVVVYMFLSTQAINNSAGGWYFQPPQ